MEYVFYSYAHEDEKYREQLEKHLSLLRRQGIISEWHDRQIVPGMNWAQTIDDHLLKASIILLLISPDFLASDYCYGIEMKRALERHEVGDAVVIPILLRAVDWKDAPFAYLQCLPRNGKPIRTWRDRDAAFSEIAKEIRLVIGQLHSVLNNFQRSPFSSGMFPPPLNRKPTSYIPFPRSRIFQPRPGEFDRLEMLLSAPKAEHRPTHVGLVGVTGMGGVGKTQLAVELAYRFLDQRRFPGGIFWMTAVGKDVYDWQPRFAELAFKTGYLPSDDDISSPENERRRAIHFCRYLAGHDDALLILDNVEDINLVTSALPSFAGSDAACSILYTSRSLLIPPGTTIHSVEMLPLEGALRLLLETTRPTLLKNILAGSSDPESQAAHSVCQKVGYLPLALIHLRGLLTRDRGLSLVSLAEVLQQRGLLEIAKTQQVDAPPIFEVFWLSWEKLQSVEAMQLFKLASYFPEATHIPVWLLAIASGFNETWDMLGPLWEACMQLQEISFIEVLSGGLVRVHPLVREFGQRLIASDDEKRESLREEAGRRLASIFADLNSLESRAQRIGYWICLEQVRSAYEYATLLGTDVAAQLQLIERWLDRESYLFVDERLWPMKVPGLLYQQLFNLSVEEGRSPEAKEAPRRWIRQETQAGVEDQSLLRVFAGHSYMVSSVAFSPDGTKILTGSEDDTARLWETASGKLLRILEGHTGKVKNVTFSPDGTKILTGSHDGTARLWEISTGKPVTLHRYANEILSVAFSPDGSKVLTGLVNGRVYLRETNSGRKRVSLLGHSSAVYGVAFSPDSSKVLTGSHDGTARLWDAMNGQTLAIFDCRSSLQIWDVTFHPDGSKVLIGSHNGTARLWDITNGHEIATFHGHTNRIMSVAFSPDGSKILTGSADSTARLWETSSGRLLENLSNGLAPIWDAAFSPEGSKVLTSAWDGSVRLLETSSGSELVVIYEGQGDPLSNIHINDPLRVAFSPDGSKALMGFRDGTARLWEITDEREIITLNGHSDMVRCIAFSPDGSKILTGSEDNTARLWETSSGRLLITLSGHSAEVWDIAFSPDGSKAITGAWDGSVRLWDIDTGRELTNLRCHSNRVTSVAFSPDGSRILMGAWDGSIQIWETTDDWRELVTLRFYSDAVANISFSPNRRLMITCDGHGKVFFLRGDAPEAGDLLGLYVASDRVEDVYWQDTEHIVLADRGGPHYHPRFYRLKLEGLNT